MKIRHKVIVLLAALFAVLAAAQFLVQQRIVLPSFAQLERDAARKDMDRVAYPLERELDLLGISARDWGNWADTHAFMQDHNPAYIAANLTDEEIAMLRVNALARDVGMDGFLAKPYSLMALRAMLADWLPGVGAEVVGTATAPFRSVTSAPGPALTAVPSMAPLPSTPVINPKAIATLRELKDPDGGDLIAGLVRTFVDEAGDNFARLVAAVAAGDAKGLARQAHSSKSGAANLGAEALAARFRMLEKCGREGRMGDAASLVEALQHEQTRALNELQRLLAVEFE